MRSELTCPSCSALMIWPTNLRGADLRCPRCNATIPNPATGIQEEPALPSAESSQREVDFGSRIAITKEKEADGSTTWWDRYGCLVILLLFLLLMPIIGTIIYMALFWHPVFIA
jgi:hypothetical protein